MAEEAAHFLQEHAFNFLNVDRAADHPHEMLPVGTKAIAVRYQHQSLVVSNKLSTHLEPGPVGIDGTILAQFIQDIGRVDDYQMSPESGDRAYGACLTCQHVVAVVMTSMLTVFFAPFAIS